MSDRTWTVAPLDAAWTMCEAVEPWKIWEVRRRSADLWVALAVEPNRSWGFFCEAEGETPVAALLALAAKLRDLP